MCEKAIKPEYVKRIFAGSKLYKFKKRLPQKDISKIIIYATAPEIIGEVKVINLLLGSPIAVWEQTKKNAGISCEKYREYFKGCKNAHDLQTDKTKTYNPPKLLSDFGILNASQSFVYIDE